MKILLSSFVCLCVTIILGYGNLLQAHAANDVRVTICEPDYQPIKYCNEHFNEVFKSELQKQPNFDTDKHLIITKLPMPYEHNEGIFEYYFVVLDTKQQIAYPLTLVVTNFSDDKGYIVNKPPIIRYHKDSARICVNGSIISYRNSYENATDYCYQFNVEDKDALLINDNLS